MSDRSRNYSDGDIVYAGVLRLKMKVVSATECLRGWKYKLGFLRKDGNIDKRREHRHFFENEIYIAP